MVLKQVPTAQPAAQRSHAKLWLTIGGVLLAVVVIGLSVTGGWLAPLVKSRMIEALKETYDLEYGKDALEIHEDAIERGQRILIVDDVLATGGTAAAATQLVKKLGGELHGLAFLIELLFLDGRSKLVGENVFSVLQY